MATKKVFSDGTEVAVDYSRQIAGTSVGKVSIQVFELFPPEPDRVYVEWGESVIRGLQDSGLMLRAKVDAMIQELDALPRHTGS